MKGTAEVAHGPMFIGFFVNVLLYGIMITQLYIYFSSYKKDRIWIKLFVILLLCDTVNTVFDVVYPYGSLIVHFADVEYLDNADWDPAMTVRGFPAINFG
ncbi:hypothetical protein WG66_014033 [Moniliophthora roreri]|nr:hypothetical protein WG66_014033 [Moniliophthora roreri]